MPSDPPSAPLPAPSGPRLDSWKAIAAHMGRQVRTVQRWEAEEGLPVHRLSHRKRGTVHAYAHELDAWWGQRQAQLESTPPASGTPSARGLPPRRPRRWWPTLAMLVVVAAAAAALQARRAERPSLPAPPLGRMWLRATSEGARLKTIPVGADPHALALSPDGAHVYVANRADGSISVISTRDGRVRKTLAAGPDPIALAPAPGGDRLYVANGQPGGITVIGLGLFHVSHRTLPTPGWVHDLALTPDGRYLFAAMLTHGLARIDTRTFAAEQIATPGCPAYLALAPGGRELYVSYQCGGPGGREGHDAIAVFDTASGALLRHFGGPPMVGGPLAITPDGGEILAASSDACTSAAYDHQGCPAGARGLINIFDRNRQELIGQLPLGDNPTGLWAYPDGSRFLAAVADELVVFDRARLQALERIPMAASPPALGFDHDHAFMALPGENAVAMLDLRGTACRPPQANLVAWWPGDGAPNDNWGGEPGRLMGAAGYAPGLVGQAFSLARPGDGIDFGASLRFALLSAMTVSAWVKPAGREAMPLLSELPDGPAPATTAGWSLELLNGGKARFRAGAAEVTTPAPIPPGAWTLLTASLSGPRLRIYVNGRSVATETASAPPPMTSARHVRLGFDPARKTYFHGLVDEAALYQRPLDDGAVAALAAAANCAH